MWGTGGRGARDVGYRGPWGERCGVQRAVGREMWGTEGSGARDVGCRGLWGERCGVQGVWVDVGRVRTPAAAAAFTLAGEGRGVIGEG